VENTSSGVYAVAVRNSSTGKIEISGGMVTSASTDTGFGTILLGPPTTDTTGLRLEMTGGTVEENTLQFGDHYYGMAYTYGSAGIYIGAQAMFNKTGGMVYGSDSPAANKCFSDYEIERGTAMVAAAAYYAADNRIVNSSF
jgi:hypothetical protein